MAEKLAPINVIWLQGQGCTGDTVALISAREPSLVDVITGVLPEVEGINIAFHPTIMAPHGETALSILDEAKDGKLDPFVVVLEGAVPDESIAKRTGGFFCAIGDKDGKVVLLTDVLDGLKGKAAAMVAIGTCATFGGVAAGKPNPTGAMGLWDFLGHSYRSTLGLPVINVSGCPTPGDSTIKALAYLVLVARGAAAVPQLDEYNRPMFLYGELAHHVCPRAGYIMEGKFTHHFGEPYCMGMMGCKGPISYCRVPKYGFANGYGGCPTTGSPCIGCTEAGFPDKPFSPFLQKSPVTPWVREGILDNIGKVKATLHRFVKRSI
jgi:hydrogenase small subunit